MSDDVRTALERLLHDVAKHVTRTARNVRGDAEIDARLVPLLVTDLYRLDGTRRASAVFEERRDALLGALDVARSDAVRTRLANVTEAFAEIDALESRVTRGEGVASTRAVTLALAIERSLRELEDSLRALVAELPR